MPPTVKTCSAILDAPSFDPVKSSSFEERRAKKESSLNDDDADETRTLGALLALLLALLEERYDRSGATL